MSATKASKKSSPIPTDKTNIKKKKSRFFETYISKILKQVHPSNGITSNAKQQLNSALCIVARNMSLIITNLTEIAKKKTISDKEISNCINILFSGCLKDNSIKEGLKSVTKFQKKSSKGSSRQGKAGIIFPPSIAEKFLRNFGYSKIRVTSSSPVFFATALEYLAAEILLLSGKSAIENKRIRITIRDLQISVQNDTEISQLFKRLNLSFLGGGVLPYIHPNLTVKKARKKRKVTETNGVKKPHRFRPGTVAIREIKKFQKTSNCLTFAKFPFERFVRNLVNLENKGMKISKDVFIILQYFAEQRIVDILRDANAAAIHSGRVKLMPVDIKFVCKLRGLNSLEEKERNENEDEDENENEDENEDELVLESAVSEEAS